MLRYVSDNSEHNPFQSEEKLNNHTEVLFPYKMFQFVAASLLHFFITFFIIYTKFKKEDILLTVNMSNITNSVNSNQYRLIFSHLHVI